MAIGSLQIERLLLHQSSEHPVISLYLNVTPPRDFTTELRSLVHATTTQLEQSKEYNDDQLRELKSRRWGEFTIQNKELSTYLEVTGA